MEDISAGKKPCKSNQVRDRKTGRCRKRSKRSKRSLKRSIRSKAPGIYTSRGRKVSRATLNKVYYIKSRSGRSFRYDPKLKKSVLLR